MRGKDQSSPVHVPSRRITPAYAGKRLIEKSINPINQDHPRLCGEKILSFATLARRVGSPPPMRGKARPVRPLTCLARDHPRLCGEKFLW